MNSIKTLVLRSVLSCVLSVLSVEVAAQSEKSRLSISPHFGLGMVLPGQQNVIGGNERMIYKWSFYNIGNVSNAAGEQSFSFETTNRFGVDLNYRISDKLKITLGAERINQLSVYRPSLSYIRNGAEVSGIIDDFHYYNSNVGLRYEAHSLFYVLKGVWIPNVNAVYKKRARNDVSSGSNTVDFLNQNNTGLRFRELGGNDIKASVYVGIGQDISFGYNDFELEVGLNLAAVPLAISEVSFLRSGSTVGVTQTNRLINTIFVSLNQELNFRERTPKSKRRRKPKLKKDKIEEKVEVGKEAIQIGEELVLTGLIFERGSSELDPTNESDLMDVLTFMRIYSKARIQITGHTSGEGDRRANIKLSEDRAKACKSYLVSLGISSSRIITLGRGPDSPVSSLNPEKNRRVEMKILSLD
ncbi:MAG: outer membrane protein OmpA-like peptidoglycan-associated protein [Arcticibacterium sp.]|jgi:outer membrane protein OmpA-like peptidoglycan-associated protein